MAEIIEPANDKAFLAYLARARAEVSTWPEWKRTLLGGRKETQLPTLVLGCGRKLKPGCINLDSAPLSLLRPPKIEVHEWGVATTWDDMKEEETWFVQFDLDTICHSSCLPFPSEKFDGVEAEDVLEHVARPIEVVQEIGRVLKVGGTLWIRGPDYRHGDIVWADLTHRRAFAPRTFDGFCPSTWDGQQYGHYHGPIKFHMVKRAIEINKGLEWEMVKDG